MSNDNPRKTWEAASAYIKDQEPLHNVYESSDFNQGILRGRALERSRIIKLLGEELSQEQSERAGYIMDEENYPVQWDRLLDLIKGENK